jgi:ketosteroid isomerase-like protein
MKKPDVSLTVLFFILLLYGCRNESPIEKGKVELLATDREFSQLSAEKGMIKAFLAYLDDEGVLLRPHSMPIAGRDVIAEKFGNLSDTSFTLTWEPLFADIAGSGDLGYTYGVYHSQTADSLGTPVVRGGTYVTIWKKNSQGKWKMVLDTGNEGTGKR